MGTLEAPVQDWRELKRPSYPIILKRSMEREVENCADDLLRGFANALWRFCQHLVAVLPTRRHPG